MADIRISIADRQKIVSIDRRRLRRIVREIIKDAGMSEAEIGIAAVDDRTIAALHEEFLGDSAPTDVLSFLLERSPRRIEGEVVVSAETAAASAPRYGNSAEDELLLYAIHGALHLVGYDDATPRQRAEMRKKEKQYLRK